MTNIIYIGPYRQYDYIGIVSELHIRSILKFLDLKKHKLFLRPLYLSKETIRRPFPVDLLPYETLPESLNSDTYIIQHAPTDYLSTQSLWHSIAVPVLDSQIHKASKYNAVYSRLNRFNHIVVSSDHEKNLLLKSEINAPCTISQFNPAPYLDKETVDKKYDFGLLAHQMYYYGFVGSYKENISIIQQLIIAFSIASRSLPYSKMVFFLRGTQQDKNEIEKFYHEMCSVVKIQNSNIQFIFGYLDMSSSFTALNSIDCLVSLNNGIQQHLFENYMTYQGKTVISKNNLNLEIAPSCSNAYDIEDVINNISLKTLVDKIKDAGIPNSALRNKNTKNSAKTIGEVLCQIVK